MTASPSQIVPAGGPAVLFRDDVFEFEWKKREVVFVELTILAAAPASRSHKSAQRNPHAGRPRRDSSRRARAWRMATKSPTITYVSYSSRSSGVNSPSLHLRANWRNRVWL